MGKAQRAGAAQFSEDQPQKPGSNTQSPLPKVTPAGTPGTAGAVEGPAGDKTIPGPQSGAQMATPLRTAEEISKDKSEMETAQDEATKEKFPTTHKGCMALLETLSNEQVETRRQWELKQPRIKALRLHMFHITQGLPIVIPDATSLALAHQTRRPALREMLLKNLGRTNPAIKELIDQRNLLLASNVEASEVDPPALAATLYTAYCTAVGNKSAKGESLPSWDEFSKDEKKSEQVAAWVATAKAAVLAILAKAPKEKVVPLPEPSKAPVAEANASSANA